MFTDEQSRLMRALSYRFLNKNKFIKLKKKINQNVFINPMFYVYVIKKNFFKSELEKKALLDSQFHYDFPFSVYANTYWVALNDVNEETGTLCFPKTRRLISKFLPYKNFKNRYNIDKYYKNASTLDPLVRKDAVKLSLKGSNTAIFFFFIFFLLNF